MSHSDDELPEGSQSSPVCIPNGAALEENASSSSFSQQLQPPSNAYIDFDHLVREADPKVVQNEHLFNQIGLHCQTMDKAHSDLGALVVQLRDAKVKLADFASFNVAKAYMRDKHPRVSHHHHYHHHHHHHQNLKRDILA